MICGLHLIASDGCDAVKIDLCPGLGQWRVQTLDKDEFIIGLHSYIVAEDEPVEPRETGRLPFKTGTAAEAEEGEWLDSLGFLVYKFMPYEAPKPPARAVGRPRKSPTLE